MRGWLAHQGMQAHAASSHAELLGLQRLQMRYPLRSLCSFSLAMTSRPRSHPPTSHATMQARAASSHAELPGLPRLQMLARLSPSVLPLPLLTCHGSHPCCNSATDSRGRSPRHGAAEGPTITPYPPLVTDIPPTLLVAQILHKARAASHPQQHCAPCSSITLHSSITEAEAARSASTCLRS